MINLTEVQKKKLGVIEDKRVDFYFKVENEIVDNTTIFPNIYESYLFVILSRDCNNGGVAFASYTTLAEACYCSRRTIIKVMNSIENITLLITEAQEEVLKTSKSLPLLVEKLNIENKKNLKLSREELVVENKKIMDSILQTRNKFEKIKRESRDSLKGFIDRSLFLKEELRDYIICYFTKAFFFNAFLIIGFLIGSYYFYYKEAKKDIREIKSVLKLEEK